MRYILMVLLFIVSISMQSQGFLHADGQDIVDGAGERVLLRGLGLGGWMVQEGYMLQTSNFAGPQHAIKQKIVELIGPEKTEAFYDAYLKNSVTKRDIDSLKSWGFNTVRLPMHYNLYTPPIEDETNGEITWIEKGFSLTDSLLKWCEANKMYLILDLHAAPGGQGKDANISDYDESKPSLWDSEANKQKMIAFWKKVADRYKDEPWIGGYDIINEPNWSFTGDHPNGCDETDNGPLRQLMMDITKAIREVDANHMVIIAGNCWGNNYNGIFPLWDDNTVISFHKYWNFNTQEEIQFVLDYRSKFNAPLWLSESGENSNVWFRDAISLMEKNDIGWCFWPMKKVDNIAGVTSVTKNPAFDSLLKYWEHGGEKPTVQFAEGALMQLVENFKMQHVLIQKDVIDAMFRQVGTDTTLAYTFHEIPGKIPAVEFDLGSHNNAYFDTTLANYWVSTDEHSQGNTGRKFRNDAVDIQVSTDSENQGYEVFDIADGEWLLFTVNVNKSASYDLEIRYASPNQRGELHLEMDSKNITSNIELPVSSNSYSSFLVKGIYLKEGVHKMKVLFDTGGFQLKYLKFTPQ
ncbi:cellulase family glycosylhydrolase [Mangrovimonas sp. AS39]|uniref:cellulase family glycosylhydrolase n=1 Tax=Mangrovimonas futianensis TaxID=2895523 RepID=UPI001E3C1437|nr:cellulase family glycosylhydrolase [Mangrovimonas futianensis]MCF1191017.1 cellulase family glycosylhydrolase [Mangrovimonas futianensis]MCF1194712.1 cellulase family glycosylhydrolase [Mangrovimonas futianensis]